MVPILLDPVRAPFAVIGEGPQAQKRLVFLDESRVGRVLVFAPHASEALAEAAGARLVRHWPGPADLEGLSAVFVGDMPSGRAEAYFVMARSKRVPCNVEDVPALCDFHVPSVLRRGDLLLTVSTGGKSPSLARRLRRWLATLIGPEWSGHLEAIAQLRQGWRAAGLNGPEISARTDAAIEAAGWLPHSGAVRVLPSHEDETR